MMPVSNPTSDIDPMTREPGEPADMCPACGRIRHRVNQELCDACQAELDQRHTDDDFVRWEWSRLISDFGFPILDCTSAAARAVHPKNPKSKIENPKSEEE